MTFSSLKSKSLFISLVAGSMLLAVPAAFSQTLSIVAGQGQLVGPSQSTQPLTVKLLDASGNPIAGAPITFTGISTYGGYVPFTSQYVVTAGDGTASSNFIGAPLIPGSPPPYDQALVSATYGSVTSQYFYVTTSNTNSSGGRLVTANFSQVGYGQSYTGAAGSVSANLIQVQVTSQVNFGTLGAGVPNVAMQLLIDPSSTGTMTCQEGPFVLTNSNGVATCTPVFGTVGTGFFTIQIGGAGGTNSGQLVQFTVTVGPPSIITINSGNNQSGTPGMTLPLPIVATVTDLGGNPTPGIAMTFTSITPNGATFTNVRQVTDAQGKVSANVILGSVPGNIQIGVTDSGGLIKNPAVFTETVILSITGLTKSTGDQQSAFINTQFPNPLVVMVIAANGQTASGTPVKFAVTSGSATVNTPNAVTNGNTAQTTVTAGNTPGPVVVTATSGQYSVTFNLTVIPPGPSNLTFTSGASGAANYLSPGSVVTIYGNGIANSLQGVTSAFNVGPLPLSLAGVSAQFGGQYFAPVFDVGNLSGSQFLTIQVPYEVPVGSTTVTIATSGGGSATVPVVILPASPGLFTYAGASNQQYLVAIKANGTVAGPSNPANRGETVTIYMTGVPLTPGISTNAFPAPGSTATPAYPIIFGIANQGTTFTSVAFSPDLAGVETLTFTVPSDLNPGAATVAIGVQAPSGIVYSQGATLNIQ